MGHSYGLFRTLGYISRSVDGSHVQPVTQRAGGAAPQNCLGARFTCGVRTNLPFCGVRCIALQLLANLRLFRIIHTFVDMHAKCDGRPASTPIEFSHLAV